MRAALHACHKYLALCVGSLWLLQACSGMVLVFHRSLDDRLLGAAARPVNLEIVDAALVHIAQQWPDASILEYFVSGGIEGQVDVLIERRDAEREVVRIDGATGSILRRSAWEEPRSQLGVFRFVLLLHKQLLAGRPGEWLIGISGALLAVNIVLGLKLGWPKVRRWRAALLPKSVQAPAARAFGWHRAMGLSLAPLALIVALTGSAMTWIQELPGASAAEVPSPASAEMPARKGSVVPPSEAVATALRLYPGASIAVVSVPTPKRAWYAIRLRQPGELRRVYGTTLVRVAANSGQVLSTVDALRISVPNRFLAALYPIHSGEWGGVATRLLAVLVGLWLVGTMGFGFMLWSARRSARLHSKELAQLGRNSGPA